MFELLPESTGETIGFRVGGKVTAADYEVLVPKLDEAIATHGKSNLPHALKPSPARNRDVHARYRSHQNQNRKGE